MRSKSAMQQGWEFSSGIMGADIAANMGASYVDRVESAIMQLEENINNHQYRNLGSGQLQGYMFEEYTAGTFNIDAVASGSSDRAVVLRSMAKDSVDIQLRSGEAYSAKSYATGAKSAVEQARFDPETGQARYHDQGRLVPTDQLSDAKSEASTRALKNSLTRPEVSEGYAETDRRLTDVIQNKEGVSSKKVSRNELNEIARESKNQNFKANEHGITLDSAIKPEYIIEQALRAGYTTAAVTVAVQLAPEIYKAIDYLIKHGELDIRQLEQIGKKGITASAEGFLRGSISSAVLIECEKGALGEAFRNINPTVLGTVVVLVMHTVKNSIMVAAGKMSTQQIGAEFADCVVTSGGYLLGAHIGGIIGQAIGFELPVMGYLLGSLIGTSFCVVYNIGKKKFISFCVDTGFTCFGLVEQNYELPEDVMSELGIETIPIPRTQVDHVEVPRAEVPTADIKKVSYETINITVLKRGLIGVNKIGYVMNT